MNREQQNEASKEKILLAALQEFGEKDYATASTNNMCKQHSISKGLLFHYYNSKDELFLLCVKKTFDALSEYLKGCCLEENKDLEEKLNLYFEARYKFFKQYPYYKNIFSMATFNPPAHLIETIDELRSELRTTNKFLFYQMLDNQILRNGLEKEEIIKMILDFGDYLQIKYRNEYATHPEGRRKLIEDQNKSIETMITLIFYGIVKA